MSNEMNEKSVDLGPTGDSMTSVRVSQETKAKLMKELDRINKEKAFGRRISPDDYIALAINLVRPEHVQKLKETAMSNQDRLEQAYLDHIKTTGSISKDEFIGLILRGEILNKSERLVARPGSSPA